MYIKRTYVSGIFMENLERRKGKKKRFFLSTLRLIFDRSARVRFTTNKTRRLTLTQLTSVTVLTGLVVCHGARGTVTLAIYPKNHRDQKSLFTYFNNFKPLLLRSINQNFFFFLYYFYRYFERNKQQPKKTKTR